MVEEVKKTFRIKPSAEVGTHCEEIIKELVAYGWEVETIGVTRGSTMPEYRLRKTRNNPKELISTLIPEECLQQKYCCISIKGINVPEDLIANGWELKEVHSAHCGEIHASTYHFRRI